MSHEVTATDTGWMFRKPAWHRLFEVGRRRPRTIAEARRVSGLTWDVQSVPFITLPTLEHMLAGGENRSSKSTVWLDAKGIRARAGEFAAPNHRAIVRTDTGAVLGVATDSYEPITNKAGFEFMEAILGKTRFEALFSVRGGELVCLLSEFPDSIEVGGDQVRRFLYTRLDHTGSGAMQTMCTNVRVQCANTDRMAVQEARLRDGIYRVRHIGDTRQRILEAREALTLSVDYSRQFKRLGDRLARQKMTEKALREVLAQLYPAGSDSDRALAGARRRHDTVVAIFRGQGPQGDTTGNAPGSRWCAYNAIVEYQQHYMPARGGSDTAKAERLFTRATDDPAGVQRRALELVMA